MTRDDGSSQVAYKGQQPYFYSGDTEASDTSGQSVSGWWKVGQEQVALQVQGSNVTSVDIYASKLHPSCYRHRYYSSITEHCGILTEKPLKSGAFYCMLYC